MRALVVYIALFLAVEVFHCDGEQNWEKWFSSNDTSEETDCTFQNYSIPNNETRNLTDPCIDVMCTTGVLIVLRMFKATSRSRFVAIATAKLRLFGQTCKSTSLFCSYLAKRIK
uniref:Putative secreted protein n=1 Tax=Amblyomma tuberculatum TaxID=48802 RepID=A0A6M2E235_9ACAR